MKFETKIFSVMDYQGNAIINYADVDIPYTRIIEHKHFESTSNNKTVISIEYPLKNDNTAERFYPINDIKIADY